MKHAYLIMIYENTLVLQRLLQLLDNEDHDIFIHIDKKARGVNVSAIKGYVSSSAIYFVKRHKVYWGDNSMVKAEMELLHTAVKTGQYEYYHLLSGADLPIKSMYEIDRFFCEHSGKEFIHFGTWDYQRGIVSRYSQYHFFARQLGRKRDKKIWVDLETYSLAIQRRLKLNRKDKKTDYYGGANWFSITHSFAVYLLQKYKEMARICRFTQNSDEWLVQTIIMNSSFKEHLYLPDLTDDYHACVRYIDWKRGGPYVFKLEDYDTLMHSDYLFARKFDEKTDREIIEKIYNTLAAKNKGEKTVD